MQILDFIDYLPRFSLLFLYFSSSIFPWIRLYFHKLILAVLCQAFNYIRTVFNIYIYTYIKFDYLVYTCQNLYILANTLANTNGFLISDFCYLASILININDILKTSLWHLADTLTNINDKINNFTKKR